MGSKEGTHEVKDNNNGNDKEDSTNINGNDDENEAVRNNEEVVDRDTATNAKEQVGSIEDTHRKE